MADSRSPSRRRRPSSSFHESHRRPSTRHRSRSPRRFSRSVRDESDLPSHWIPSESHFDTQPEYGLTYPRHNGHANST